MPTREDLSELFSSLKSHAVDYIVVGTHALEFHGIPRFTEDIDFFVAKANENIERLADALSAFCAAVPEESKAAMLH